MRRSRTLAVTIAALFALGVAAGAVDAGKTAGLKFHAQSMSWVSPQRGWLLGSTDCGTGSCTATAGTTTGGTSWKTLGSLAAPVTIEDAGGVTEVRFADDLHGWAFDPALWATNNGGVTWQQQASPDGRPVVALAADAQVAYAVVSACDYNQAVTNCRHDESLWRATPGAGVWTQVSLRLPIANQATLAVQGLTAYLVIAMPGSSTGDTVEATTDGVNWSARPSPCSTTNGEYLSSVAPVSATQVALLCQANIGFGYAYKRVLRSNDTAVTTSDAGTLNQYGIVSQLTASPSGTLLVASYSIGSWIYRNGGGTTWTTSEDLGDGGIGWNDIAFTTDQLAFVVHGPAACCGNHGPGEIWKSTDGGLTWRQTEVAPQP
jgi:hypothetical protein